MELRHSIDLITSTCMVSPGNTAVQSPDVTIKASPDIAPREEGLFAASGVLGPRERWSILNESLSFVGALADRVVRGHLGVALA